MKLIRQLKINPDGNIYFKRKNNGLWQYDGNIDYFMVGIDSFEKLRMSEHFLIVFWFHLRKEKLNI